MSLEALIQPGEREAEPQRNLTAAAAFVDFVKTPLAGIAGIEHARAEPSAERKKEEITRTLQQLGLDHELLEKLRPALVSEGFQILNQCRAMHPYKTSEHVYTGLQNGESQIALIQLPEVVFTRTEAGYEPYVSDFAHMLKAFRNRPLRLFSEKLQGTTYSFQTAFDDEKKDANWRIVNWSNVVDLCAGRLTVLEAFSLSKPSVAASEPKAVDGQLAIVVRVVQGYATYMPGGSTTEALKTLVAELGWPTKWKDALWARRTPHLSFEWTDSCADLSAAASARFAGQGVVRPIMMADLAVKVVTELQRMAQEDRAARAIIDAWGEGLMERNDVMERTGLTALEYKAARERVAHLVRRLPESLRDEVKSLLRSAS